MKKIVVVIPCHNQQSTVELCISRLEQQTVKPFKIIVIDDHSDKPPTVESSLTTVVPAEKRGRSSTRNLGLRLALEGGADVVVFIDGDAIPADMSFLESHLKHHGDGEESNNLVFGLREHVKRPIRWTDYSDTGAYESLGVVKLPSDLLTANMDALALGKRLDYTDLRVVAGSYGAFNQASGFSEKCDLVLSGMVTWSCNFSIGAEAADTLCSFMCETYGIYGWFDDNMFNDGWGYEDVALGVDAMFSGIEIKIEDDMLVKHFMHERSDELSCHILGRHRVMERYRNLLSTRSRSSDSLDDDQTIMLSSGYSVSLTNHSVTVNGRLFNLPPEVLPRDEERKNKLQSFHGDLYVNGYRLDVRSGTFHRSLAGKVIRYLLP